MPDPVRLPAEPSAGAPRQGEAGPTDPEAWFRSIVETVPHMVFVGGPDGANTYNNARLVAYTGLTSEQLAGGGWGRTIHPDDLAGATDWWAELIRTTTGGARTHRVLGRDGSYRWFRVAVEPLRDASGRVLRWIGTWTDVDEAVRAQQEVRDSERHFRLLFETMLQGVVYQDARGVITSMNPAAERILGKTREEFLGRTSADEQHHTLREDGSALPAAEHPAMVALRTGREVAAAVMGVFNPRERRYRWISVSAVPITHGGDARPVEVYTIFDDVTERRTAEQALREADQRKAEFLAVLSHELRNPLAPIRNALWLLDRAAPGGEQAVRARAVLGRQTEQLARLVDDLLDVTRISRGKVELRRERVDAREVVRRTCEDHRQLFEGRGIALHVAVPEAPAWLDADPARLAQVVANLLQNAAKFTPRGGTVRIGLASGAARGGNRGWRLTVKDDGEGIPAELLPRLFEPFAQADTGLARSAGGLGLGLALVKGLVELHGGDVEAASGGPGQGAEFTVVLPAAGPPPGAREAPAAAAAPTGRRVLVVEDNADAAETLADVLRLGGHEVEVASDGASGIARARAGHPDVVLCDIGLPDVSGYEVARTLRADPALADVRLVALSGYAQPEDRRRAREAGFDQHLAKPPPLEELESLLAGLA